MKQEEFSKPEPKMNSTETVKGFDRELAERGAHRALELQKLRPKEKVVGVHIAQATNELAKEKGIASQVAAEHLRSAIGSVLNEWSQKSKNRVKENRLQATLRDMHRLAAIRGDEDIPEEEIFAAREKM